MTRAERFGYPTAVALGAALTVITAINQPYNQNEWAQIATYDSWDPRVVASGTRQPPLDPLLGALLQHLLGVGQLQQRLVPVLCGVGSMLLMVGLLRRLRLGHAGVLALFFMASAPLFLRYSAYSRPYALPVFLLLLAAYAGTRWLDEGRRRWLVTAVAAAFLLPLSRVPEPVAFLLTSALVLGIMGWRASDLRRRTWSLAGGFLVALVTVGAITTLALSHEPTSTGQPLIDLDPVHALHRLPPGLHQLRVFVAPLYADWFPWWPLTALVVLVAVLLPLARRTLLRTWYWLPLVGGPLAFLVAYHSINTFPLVVREYRPRFAYFWMPSLTVLVAVAAHAVGQARLRHARWVGLGLVGALLVSQLPTTWKVLTTNHAADVGQAATVIQEVVPDAGVVIYDGPSPIGFWRQPFFGTPRYFAGDHARVVNAWSIAGGKEEVAEADGPVYLMVLAGPCVYSVACDAPHVHWSGTVDGWRPVRRFDQYVLYAPADGQAGRAGAIEALSALAEAYGPAYGVTDWEGAARLLAKDDRLREARQLLRDACAAQETAALAARCRADVRKGAPLG